MQDKKMFDEQEDINSYIYMNIFYIYVYIYICVYTVYMQSQLRCTG